MAENVDLGVINTNATNVKGGGTYWNWGTPSAEKKDANGNVIRAANGSCTTPVSLDELANFEYDGTNYIYDMPPAQPNLFWAGNMSSGMEGNLADSLNSARNSKRTFHNAQFRIQSVQIEGITLQFDEDPYLTHRDYFVGVQLSKNVTITWLEDVYFSVKKYHMDWLTNWYDSYSDSFTTGTNGKLRQLDVVAFHYKQSKSIYEEPVVEPILLIALRGLIPTKVGDFTFDTSQSGKQIVTMSYRMNHAMVFYNSALNDGKNNEDMYINVAEQSSVIWSPIIAPGVETSDENNRILHQVHSTLPSEGRIS